METATIQLADLDAEVAAIVRKVAAAIHPRRITLFGSRARGTHHADSDVDLLVEVDAEEKDCWRLWKLANEAIFPRFLAVDLLLMTLRQAERAGSSRNHVVADARREGKVVFEHA